MFGVPSLPGGGTSAAAGFDDILWCPTPATPKPGLSYCQSAQLRSRPIGHIGHPYYRQSGRPAFFRPVMAVRTGYLSQRISQRCVGWLLLRYQLLCLDELQTGFHLKAMPTCCLQLPSTPIRRRPTTLQSYTAHRIRGTPSAAAGEIYETKDATFIGCVLFVHITARISSSNLSLRHRPLRWPSLRVVIMSPMPGFFYMANLRIIHRRLTCIFEFRLQAVNHGGFPMVWLGTGLPPASTTVRTWHSLRMEPKIAAVRLLKGDGLVFEVAPRPARMIKPSDERYEAAS